MPNNKGGKNYKKSKHHSDAPIIFECAEDQMYGRAVKILGNRNVLVYCNDGRERICHIRGSMRKRTWISSGDILLVSVRDYGKEVSETIERGDICAKYDPSVISKLRQRDTSINPRLFENLTANTEVIDEGGFEFDENAKDATDEESSDDDDDGNKERLYLPKNRITRQTILKDGDDDDGENINIDNI
jgi:translation initiation factor 1A